MAMYLSSQRGMSLVEMMITVAILFVVSAIAIPAYNDYMVTARQEAMLARAETFRAHATNYRIDNGTYLAGAYDVGAGVNDFADTMGFRVDNDTSGISFKVEAGDCGNIADCYQVVLRDDNGNELLWTPTGFEFTAFQ